MVSPREFNKMFSFPRTPETALAPGQYDNLNVPDKMKVLITDVYIENLGGGISNFRILEQRGPVSFEVRYTFRTAAQQVTTINFTTGLKLGDEAPITGAVRIENASGSQASIVPRINGIFVS